MHSDWLWGLGGGFIIGLAGAIFLLMNGRIMGASGIVGGLVDGSGRSNAAERGGSGIGLALAKRLVESHGGKIRLVSNDSTRGSTFHVWWPRFERRS